jgi:hypothetical protein
VTYSQDMWLRPVVLTSANNKFRLYENTSVREVIVSVAAGTYYLHADSTLSAGGFPSLYLAIEALIFTTTTPVTYTFSNATPSASGGQTGVGLALTTSAGSFTVDFADADFTMDAGWFGSLNTESITSTTKRIVGRYTVLNQWYLNTISSYAQASNKRSSVQREISYSHERPSDRYAIEWYSERTRTITYEYVPAAHIFESGAKEQIYADTGRLALNDVNNAWETIWSGLSRDETIFIVHNVDSKWNLRDVLSAGGYESVKLFGENQARDLGSTIKLTRSAAEMYTISVDLWLGSTQGYAH